MRNGQKKRNLKSNKPFEYKVKEQMELLPFLLKVMSKRSRNSVKSILSRGQVSINSQVETAFNFPLKQGQTVTIHKNQASTQAPFTGFTILHEDDDVIVINKESGLLSIASSKEKEITAYRQLMDYVRSVHPRNRVFIVHRLDRDTSGVMMFAKSEKVKRKLQDAWKDMVKERTYVALVEGVLKKASGTISSWLKESKTLRMYSSPKPNGGKRAITHYKVIQSNKNYTLLELQLETGRKNQIRVHMEDIGHPIVGDKKYRSKNNEIGRLGLHAHVLAFVHPATDKVMWFETDIPKEFLSKSR